MTTEPRDPAGLNEPDEPNCGEGAERASPPTPSSDGGLAAIAAASADPGGHQAAGSETAGGEDTASPRHAGERNDERRSDLGVGPPSSQAPTTSPNAAPAGADGLTTAEPRLTGGGDGAQRDEAVVGQQVLDDLYTTLQNSSLPHDSSDHEAGG